MKQVFLLGSIALAALALSIPFAPAGAPKKSESVVKMKAKVEKSATGKEVVVLNLEIEPGWHLYGNPVDNADLAGSEVVVKVTNVPAKIEYPAGKVVDDPIVGKYKVYKDKIEIRATLDRAAGNSSPLELSVRLQSCNDKVCLPPATVKVNVP